MDSPAMTRTLLPVWAIYKQDLFLKAQEPMETFDWIPDSDTRSYYVEARAGLDSISGSLLILKWRSMVGSATTSLC